MREEILDIRLFKLSDVEALLKIKIKNKEFFQQYQPFKPASHYTIEGQKKEIEKAMQDFKDNNSYIFGVFLKETNELIGRVALTNVVYGPFQNASIGYFIGQEYNGRGYATRAVKLAIQYAFEELQLHRIQAGVMPRNKGSIHVLEKAGFRFEGLARRYLQINQNWEDHRLYAITREDYEMRKKDIMNNL